MNTGTLSGGGTLRNWGISRTENALRSPCVTDLDKIVRFLSWTLSLIYAVTSSPTVRE